VVRSYPVKKNGAGYSAEIVNILKNEKDQWFRPADVCVAPDGSLIIADWYDPGVGGHAAGDLTRGRIYRVAPKGSKYIIPKQDYSTTAGAINALQNPNLAVRYHAYSELQRMGFSAISDLEKLWRSSADPRMKARAFWVLAKMTNVNARQYIGEAIKDNDADIRISGLRAACELNNDVIATVKQLVNDPDAQVRRECAIALHHNKSPEAAELWAALAKKHDGKDRWYLEALGIGADQQWDKFFAAYLVSVKDPLQADAGRDIVWRARTEKALPYIAALASDNKTPINSRLRYFRAFDFNNGPAKSAMLLKMIQENSNNDVALNKLVLRHLDVKTVTQNPAARKALQDVLRSISGTDEYVELVARYELKTENTNLLQLALSKHNEETGQAAAALLLQLGGRSLVWDIINNANNSQQK
jgi:hypothetical protein